MDLKQKCQSAIYQGRVQHRRHTPHPHVFCYPICMMYIDLSELDLIFSKTWFWSLEKMNVGSFRRRDYLGDPTTSLDQAVRDCAFSKLARRPAGPIRMLAHLRYFGHCFNPVSFYYCFEPDGQTLDCIVAEITNTPWRERHAYVLDARSSGSKNDWFEFEFDKAFHVSPFFPMQLRYDWRFSLPANNLNVQMNLSNSSAEKQFDASLNLQRSQINGWNLTRVLWQYPLMTIKVVAAIHWQAFLLWLKQITVYDHPIHHAEKISAQAKDKV